MLDRSLVFLDLETTGATASFDRITEIGVIEVERGRWVGEWSTLINPQARIPPFIEALTGISNDMVALAPTFAEIAPELKARLDGKLLVAHNARFDYGFLKQEFRRLDIKYASDVVCTVKLSRKLFPGHARHNLDSLMERHGVACDARHRALGDARVLWELAQIWRDELGHDALAAATAAQLKSPTLPPGLSELVLDEVPEAPGVYLFYGDNDIPLYVGKSINLRSRVLAHFSGDHRLAKDMRIVQQVKRVDWKETAGELGALLEEARLVKELLPILNRQLRRNNDWYAFAWDPAQRQALQLISGADVDFSDTAHVYGLFRTKRTALDTLRNLAQAFELCLIATGLEKGQGPCFAHQIKRCRGVCAGKESRARHDLRLTDALSGLKLQAWPFKGRVGVREANGERTDLHVLDHWCYLGTVRAEHELDALDARPAFDLDIYKILKRFLAGAGNAIEIVPMAG
ncbi:MAG: ethanolamine utilization protein [Betaproteobacteria bacterium]|nr:MAG: ethanolamine utilization protein [Betaproteobacteria bacterium]